MTNSTSGFRFQVVVKTYWKVVANMNKMKTYWKVAANMNKMKTCWSVREYFCSQLYFFLWIAWGPNLIPNFLNFCPFCQREGTPKLIYVTTATTGAGVLFQDVALFWQISGTQGAPHCIIAFFNIDAMLRPELAPPASPCNKIEAVFLSYLIFVTDARTASV